MRKAGVSPVIGTIFLVSIAVVIGFGVWAIASGFSSAFMVKHGQDTGAMIDKVRSSLVVEYAAVIGGELKACVYNNGEVDLKLVDIVFLDKTGHPLTPLSPQDVADLDSKSRNRVCVSRAIPSGEGSMVARFYAIPSPLFNPDNPAENLDRAVYTEYLIGQDAFTTTTTTTTTTTGGGESIGLLYFYKESGGTNMRWLKTDPPAAGGGQYVELEVGDEEWWATVDTYDLGPASSGTWILHFEYEGVEEGKPSRVHVEIYVSNNRETAGDRVGLTEFDVPAGDGSMSVGIDVTISDDGCNDCYVQVKMSLVRPDSSYAHELRVRVGRNGSYTTLRG